jgi:pimeloyl-ACP methyl ester carboxylesterase
VDRGAVRAATADDGVLLQYEVAGPEGGEPVVFLHGGMGSRFAFRRQREALAGDFRLLLRDLRGHNGSEARVPPGYALDTTEIGDLRAVLDAERIERAHLVGHSTGGAIAFLFALRHPERVARMVLIEPTLLSFVPAEMLEAEFAENRKAYAIAEREGPVAALHVGLASAMGEGWQGRMRPEALAQLEASAPLLIAQGQATNNLVVTEADLRALAAPTLLVYGGRSFAWERPIRERVREDLICCGDKVVARGLARGTHVTGKKIVVSWITIIRVSGGKIAEYWDESDVLGFMQQMGAFPQPGRPGE